VKTAQHKWAAAFILSMPLTAENAKNVSKLRSVDIDYSE